MRCRPGIKTIREARRDVFQCSPARMETLVQLPEDAEPCTIREVCAALRAKKLEPLHEAKNWGDWIRLDGMRTVISIESMRGLTTSATIEHAEGDADEAIQQILAAFHKLGWHGVDDDGPYPLG